MRKNFCKLHSLFSRNFFYYHTARKVSPSAIRDTHVNTWLSWKLQNWRFAASVFCFILSSLMFLWRVRVSVLVFEFLGCLELFVWLNSVVEVPGWMNNMQFIKGEATWIVTKDNITQQFSWPPSSTESMGISPLASVGLSSSLLREYCTRRPLQTARLIIPAVILIMRKYWAETQGQWKSAVVEGSKVVQADKALVLPHETQPGLAEFHRALVALQCVPGMAGCDEISKCVFQWKVLQVQQHWKAALVF